MCISIRLPLVVSLSGHREAKAPSASVPTETKSSNQKPLTEIGLVFPARILSASPEQNEQLSFLAAQNDDSIHIRSCVAPFRLPWPAGDNTDRGGPAYMRRSACRSRRTASGSPRPKARGGQKVDRMICFALDCEIGQYFSDDGSEFEAVSGKTCRKNEPGYFRMAVDDEIFVRRHRVDASREPRELVRRQRQALADKPAQSLNPLGGRRKQVLFFGARKRFEAAMASDLYASFVYAGETVVENLVEIEHESGRASLCPML
ncbi:hypothetical protein WOC76_23290 [Methylocystis sp. IM3]|uniref:hypothetical protein n=1 Tax=unclassified Methylocystis TaxID=2625913 RepID=UPI0030F5EE98